MKNHDSATLNQKELSALLLEIGKLKPIELQARNLRNEPDNGSDKWR